ncbi:FecCD family ABC transporter permease [Psychrobacter lutiphocae]|uniref:FecCD family ABC transporter permease n=1 Tax=Psychrobacter lutiphocae TaxID=540500 RepID=UPI000373FFFF|nr:iron ABC transporter permease [Psychrobacter lutiphocae]
MSTVSYQYLNRKKLVILGALVVLCFISFVVDVAVGPAMLSIEQVLKGIFTPNEVESNIRVIMSQIRLPIALMALLIGCLLGTAGAVMQTILHNPLASPYTLGVGSGAAFGASLAIVLGLGATSVSLLSFIFSISVCMLIYLMGKNKNLSTNSMVLSGIALTFLFQALQALIQYGSSETQNQAIVFWTFGSLQRTSWTNLAITATVTFICVPLLLKDAWKYTGLLMGDEKAESLGIRVDAIKLKAMILISLMASVAVSFTGTIGFIGLAAPHVATRLVGEEKRYHLITSALCGMLLLSFASIISKAIMPGIIYPIGIVTSIIGVPFFFTLVLRRKKGQKI